MYLLVCLDTLYEAFKLFTKPKCFKISNPHGLKNFVSFCFVYHKALSVFKKPMYLYSPSFNFLCEICRIFVASSVVVVVLSNSSHICVWPPRFRFLHTLLRLPLPVLGAPSYHYCSSSVSNEVVKIENFQSM